MSQWRSIIYEFCYSKRVLKDNWLMYAHAVNSVDASSLWQDSRLLEFTMSTISLRRFWSCSSAEKIFQLDSHSQPHTSCLTIFKHIKPFYTHFKSTKSNTNTDRCREREQEQMRKWRTKREREREIKKTLHKNEVKFEMKSTNSMYKINHALFHFGLYALLLSHSLTLQRWGQAKEQSRFEKSILAVVIVVVHLNSSHTSIYSQSGFDVVVFRFFWASFNCFCLFLCALCRPLNYNWLLNFDV